MTRILLRGLALTAAAGLLALVPACGSGGSGGRGGKAKVAIVTNCTDPFWDICQAGAAKVATEFDLDVTFKQPEQGTVDYQMKMVDDLVRLGIKGLAVSVINPKEQTPELKALARDLPRNAAITMDTVGPGVEPLLTPAQVATRGGSCGQNIRAVYAHLDGPPDGAALVPAPQDHDLWALLLGPLAPVVDAVVADEPDQLLGCHAALL
ncbi:MAG: hypothetical protein ABGY75_10465, partial [Gemmataceae bacterium]